MDLLYSSSILASKKDAYQACMGSLVYRSVVCEELALGSSNTYLEGFSCPYIPFLCCKASDQFSGKDLFLVLNLLETDLTEMTVDTSSTVKCKASWKEGPILLDILALKKH